MHNIKYSRIETILLDRLENLEWSWQSESSKMELGPWCRTLDSFRFTASAILSAPNVRKKNAPNSHLPVGFADSKLNPSTRWVVSTSRGGFVQTSNVDFVSSYYWDLSLEFFLKDESSPAQKEAQDLDFFGMAGGSFFSQPRPPTIWKQWQSIQNNCSASFIESSLIRKTPGAWSVRTTRWTQLVVLLPLLRVLLFFLFFILKKIKKVSSYWKSWTHPSSQPEAFTEFSNRPISRRSSQEIRYGCPVLPICIVEIFVRDLPVRQTP